MSKNSDLIDICNNIVKWINKSIKSKDIAKLVDICDVNKYDNKYTIDDIRQVVDTAFKQKSQQLVNENDLLFENIEDLLNMSILAARHEICPGNLPVMLLSDIFDCRTLDECQQLFVLIENKVDIWKEEVFFKNVKNQLLRSCNDLLRRLSRSQDTVFCGRILVFLAHFFPFFERSGLNLISEFNHENATTFAVEDNILSESIASVSHSQDEHESKESEKILVDYNFYRKFWQLQDSFRNPNSCYNRTQWKQLQTYTNDILQAFSSFKLDPNSCANFQGLGDNNSDNLYFAKYLTNQRLLELQLSDSNFRRYILVQFLILFQYLTSNVRFKQEVHSLTEDQSIWVTETTNKINELIEETPPHGPEVRKSIEKILKREEFWNNWKNDGCPELKPITENESEMKKTETSIKQTYTRKRKLGDELKEAESQNRILIGNQELNTIWNLCADNWESCRSKKRLFIPSVEKFFENAVKATHKQRQEICSDSDFTWRALRLLSQKSHHFFSPSNQVVKTVNSHLETVVEKLSKEFPTTIHNNNNDFDIDDAEDISDDELLKNVDPNTTPNTPNDYSNEADNTEMV
ncbi:THO complex subunit 1-like [Oppia nitens]|uniref:THO complex subunit 1-like n=1 Tax=Oppia nitens TaxID=1686743 RepID=UPI0023D9A5DE|nr:THO complex subunit 1-like [Oppia nitens]